MVLKKKNKKSVGSLASGIIGTGIGLGVGTSILSKVPNTTAAQTALGTFSGALPTIAKVGSAGIILGAIQHVGNDVERKMRKRR